MKRFATLAIAAFTATSLHASTLISVTTDAITPVRNPPNAGVVAGNATRAANLDELYGPAGDTPGPDNTWNTISGFGSSNLLDSNGVTTDIGWTSTYSERRTVGAQSLDLEIARIFMQDFGRGTNTLTINGLDVDETYNIWLVSVSNSGAGREFYRGDISTTNATISPSSQEIFSSPRNTSTFVAGQNFVEFRAVTPDSNGEIEFTLAGAQVVVNGQPDAFRLGLNGFQIEVVPTPSAAVMGALALGGLLVRRRRG